MTLVPSITLFMVCLNTDIPHLFMTLMLIISFGGVALCYPVAFMKSMSVFTDLKGASSSAIFGMRMLILSIVIGCQSMTYDGTVFSVAKMILGCMILGGVIVLYTLKRGFFKDTPSKTEAISA